MRVIQGDLSSSEVESSFVEDSGLRKEVESLVLAIIPARGGSKGIPNKNKRLICGKPLIAWTILAAQMANSVDKIVVSTDDEDIAEIARGLGVEVPFMRPPGLARDETPGSEPVQHVLSVVKGFESAVLLQPTSPLRTSEDIDGLADSVRDACSVVSVCATPEPIEWTFTIQANGSIKPISKRDIASRRQVALPTYTLNGALYYFEIPWFLKGGTFIDHETLPYIMPRDRSIDIDSEFDWKIAEFLLSSKGS
jgi:CMP-N,N'-diacetyllegionaminic acid synthase